MDPTALRLDPEEVAASQWVTLDEVRERYRAGVFAAPWVARLDGLWPALTAAVSAGEKPR